MKKITILGGCLFALALTSCNYLDREPLDAIGKDQYFASANAAALEQYCNNFYPDLIAGHGGAKGFSFGMMDRDMMSDDIIRWDRNETSFGLHTKPSGTNNTNWQWSIIRACNDFLDNYEQSPEAEAVKQKYAGQVLFFKTMDYFNKLNAYGDLPWYEHVLNPGDEELYKGRDSRTVVADNMLRDINQAIAWLPKSSHVTMVGKEAALALKARFCLFEASWRRYHNIEGDAKFYQEAHSAASELMKPEYGYSLYEGDDPETAYYNLFIQADYNNNSEVILSRAYDPAKDLGNNITRTIFLAEGGSNVIGFSKSFIDSYLCANTGKPTSMCGCPEHTHPATLAEELSNRDPRLLQVTPNPDAADTKHHHYLNGGPANVEKLTTTSAASRCATGYPVVKYYNVAEATSNHNVGTLDAPVFRLGEMLLIRAEAAAELGNITQAELDITINALRARVGFNHKLTMSPDVDPQLVIDYPNVSGANATLIREIRRERRIELVGEGFRYDDIRRWACGKLLEAPRLGINLSIAGYTAEDEAILREQVGVNAEGYLTPYGVRYAGMNPNPVFEEPKHYLYAIPTNEIALNPNLTQNPGW